jgi:hypothetical protein
VNTTTDRPARRRAWRGARLQVLGLLAAAGMLLATVTAGPASAGATGHLVAPAQQPGRHLATAGSPMTLAQAPAGLRSAVRAALGLPTGTPGRSAAQNSAATQSVLVPRDHRADFFGISIAVSRNTALVGASTADKHHGAAYVFVRRDGGWVQQARLTASDGHSRDAFGISVALDGNTAVVGASNRAEDGLPEPILHGTGAAYVFVRTGTTWSQQALLTPPPLDSAIGEFFGFSVALSGQTALIGAPGDGNETGAVFEFSRTGATWSQTSKFTGSDSVQFDTFGWTVAFTGHTAVVGAPQQDGFTGKAYVFTPTTTGFQQQAALVGPDRQTGDLFGRSVAISGNTALIGSPGVSGLTGAAYVFVRTGTHWSQQAALTASDGQSEDSLGENSVVISGNTAVAGADFRDNQTGAAYEFVRTGTTWAQKAEFTDPNGARDDSFGFGEAIAGSTALVGAPGHDHLHGQVGLFPL